MLGPRIHCPHCGAPAKVRTSQAETKLIRKLYLQCNDIECGHTFAASLEITHTISPSAKPAADVFLRQSDAGNIRSAANANGSPPLVAATAQGP